MKTPIIPEPTSEKREDGEFEKKTEQIKTKYNKRENGKQKRRKGEKQNQALETERERERDNKSNSVLPTQQPGFICLENIVVVQHPC